MHLYPGVKPFISQHFLAIRLESDTEKVLAIKALVESTSWPSTHSAIAKLAPLVADISASEAVTLFTALIENSEINSISSDSDVEEFYQSLLRDHWDKLSTADYEAVTAYVEEDLPF